MSVGRGDIGSFSMAPRHICTKETNLVSSYGIFHTSIRVRIEIICPDEDALFSSWHCEWPDSCHYITHDFSPIEGIDEPFVFCLQSAIPVYLGVIKSKGAIPFTDLNIHVILAC